MNTKSRDIDKERVVLVGCETKDIDDEIFRYSMEELESLTKTAQGEVVFTLTQKRSHIDPATYIGRGKMAELASILSEVKADVIIFNDELTASQVRNLLKAIGNEEVRIID